MVERDHRPIITIASCLQPVKKNDSFLSWPHHVTLVPPFRTEQPWTLSDICSQTAEITDHSEPIEVMAGSQNTFMGVKEPVRYLADQSKLYYLHGKLLDVVEKAGAKLLDDTHTRDAYLPHVTFKPNAAHDDPWPELGDSVRLSGIDMVSRNPVNNLKTILAHYAFHAWPKHDLTN